VGWVWVWVMAKKGPRWGRAHSKLWIVCLVGVRCLLCASSRNHLGNRSNAHTKWCWNFPQRFSALRLHHRLLTLSLSSVSFIHRDFPAEFRWAAKGGRLWAPARDLGVSSHGKEVCQQIIDYNGFLNNSSHRELNKFDEVVYN